MAPRPRHASVAWPSCPVRIIRPLSSQPGRQGGDGARDKAGWGGGWAETHVGAPGLGFISGSPTSPAWGSCTQISFPSRPRGPGERERELGMLHGYLGSGGGPSTVLIRTTALSVPAVCHPVLLLKKQPRERR